MEEARGNYIPPDIPVITASQVMVKHALQSLVTADSTQISKTGSFLPVSVLQIIICEQ